MTMLKCPCGFDSGIQEPTSGYSVSAVARKSGLFPVPLADSGLTWLCQKCAAKVAEAAALITKLVGSDLWVADSFFRFLDKR
jgi:hypothetical protein